MRQREAAVAAPITMWWIGEGELEPDVLEPVRGYVAEEFGCRVALEDAPGRPAGTYDARRRQHSSRGVLAWLVPHAGPPRHRLLGVTDVDLFIPILTFVFGEAQLDGRAAVISTARLAHPEDRRITVGRVAREAVHELGHTFGLLHCQGSVGPGWRAAPCVMSRSASVRSVDGKSLRLCADCRERYRLFQQDGTHVYREHENPHR